MEQQDYLMKQIDQLGRTLGQILLDLLGKKNDGRAVEGVEDAIQTLKSKLNLDIKALFEMPVRDFINILKTQKNFTDVNLAQLAEVLLLIADNEQSNSKALYQKCLAIYDILDKQESKYSLDRQWKKQRIMNALKCLNEVLLETQ